MDHEASHHEFEFKNIDITDDKYVDENNAFAQRRTLLIVTIADPLIQLVDFQKLMEMGMNVVRLKTSHCSETDRIKMLSRIDKATKFLARKYGLLEWPCATCIELKTTIIQTGLLEEEAHHILIETDTEVTLTTDISEFDKCNKCRIFVDDPYLTSDVKIGMEINIAQDEIILVCTGKDENSLTCTVTKGGNLENMSYVCSRTCRNGLRNRPCISQKDFQLIKFAVEYQVDMIIINYTRNIETIIKIKKFLGLNLVKKPMLIAGIASQEGLMNLDDFIRDADGILLAREFLPYEVEPTLYNRMGLIQSFVAGKCRQAGKPFYISGGIFHEKLLTGNLCIREISDVTNAILEGASGFSLSECLDINYMCDAMKMFNDVCTSVEPLCVNKTDFRHIVSQITMPVNAAEASALSCAVVANQTNARVIILPTVSGRTAYLLNWLRPNSLIIGVSTKLRTIRQLKMFRSLVPLLYKGPPRRTWFNTVQARVTFALHYAVERKWIDCDDRYITLEKATEESSFCDAVRIWNVSEKAKRTKMECPESYHDFDINSFAEPTTSKKKKESEITSKIITKVVEKVTVTEEQETTEEQVTETKEMESIEEKIVKEDKEVKDVKSDEAEEEEEKNQSAMDNPEDKP